MKTQQRALIVTTGSDKARGLDELNIALGRGWKVAHIAPMGGSGASRKEPRFAAMVILEREENSTSDVLQQTEEESEDLADEMIDGDGSSQEVSEDFNGGPPPERPD